MRASVVLPQPDSPTSATTSPGRTERLTPSTACSVRLAHEQPGRHLERARDAARLEHRGRPSTARDGGATLMTPPPRDRGRPPRRSRRGGCSARDADRRAPASSGIGASRGRRRSHAGSGRRSGSRASRRSARAPCRGWCRAAHRAACGRAPECRRAAPACRDARARAKIAAAGAGLHHLAGVHHDHAGGDAGDDAEVVRDEHEPHGELALQLGQQVQDLRLDGDVERRGRLVGQDQRRARTSAPWRSSRAGAGRRRAGADTA